MIQILLTFSALLVVVIISVAIEKYQMPPSLVKCELCGEFVAKHYKCDACDIELCENCIGIHRHVVHDDLQFQC